MFTILSVFVHVGKMYLHVRVTLALTGSPETGNWGRSFPFLPLLTQGHSLSVGIRKTPRTEKSSSALLSPTPRCSPVFAASPHIKRARRARSPTSWVAPASNSPCKAHLFVSCLEPKVQFPPQNPRAEGRQKLSFLLCTRESPESCLRKTKPLLRASGLREGWNRRSVC